VTRAFWLGLAACVMLSFVTAYPIGLLSFTTLAVGAKNMMTSARAYLALETASPSCSS